MPSHPQDLSVDDDDGDGKTFRDRQRAHFSELLREKWACSEKGHGVCVPTEDGQHFRLEDEDIKYWANALCKGSASTDNPPHVIFDNIGGGAVFNLNNGELKVRAVSIAPSRRGGSPNHRPLDPTTASINSNVARSSRNSFRSSVSWGASTTDTTTSRSSFLPGPGYFFARAINLFGERSLDAVGYTRLASRSKVHRSCLEKWEKDRTALDADVRAKVIDMLDDALEMSREKNIRNKGFHVGRAVYHWLHTYENIPDSPEILVWHIKVQVSLISIMLTRVSHSDPLAGDLAHCILRTLTRVRLAEQGTETAARVTWYVARELAYAKCSFQHAWLGVCLLRIVEMSLKLGNLTPHEIKAIKELAIRREEQPTDYSKKDDVWRPWEVALFAQCASQDLWFKRFVLGAHGLPSLIAALDTMLGHVDIRDVHWENVVLTLRSLAFLSEHEWVAEAVDPDIVRSLLGVFRRSIPERWFCIRFWAADTIRTLVVHHPPLTRTLLQENGIEAFETLINPQLDHELSNSPQFNRQRQPQVRRVPPELPIPSVSPAAQPTLGSSSFPLSSSPQQISNLLPSTPTEERRFSTTSSTPSSPVTPSSAVDRRLFGRRPSHGMGAERSASTSSARSDLPHSTARPNPRRSASVMSQGRHLEEYKVAATKRVEELVAYTRKWTEWTPDKLPMLETHGTGWLWEWEGVRWTSDDKRGEHEEEQ